MNKAHFRNFTVDLNGKYFVICVDTFDGENGDMLKSYAYDPEGNFLNESGTF